MADWTEEELSRIYDEQAGNSGGWSDEELGRIYDAQTQLAPTLWQEAQGVSNQALKGAARLGGFLYDIPKNSMNALRTYEARVAGQPAKYKLDFSTGDKLVEALNNFKPLGLVDIPSEGFSYEPQSTTGKIAGAVAEQLPAVALPIGSLGARASGAVMSGLGAGGVRAAGGSPTQELIASLAAPLTPAAIKTAAVLPKRGIETLIQALMPSKAPVTAAEIVQEALPSKVISDLAKAQRVAANSLDDPLLQYKTPAELSKSVELAGFENDIGRALPEARNAIAEKIYGENGRINARNALVEALVGQEARAIEPIERGELLRQALSSPYKAAKKQGGELYTAAEEAAKDIPIDLVPVEQQAKALYGKYFEPTYGVQPDESTRRIVEALANNTASGKEVNALSSNISQAIRMSPQAGSGRVLSQKGYLSAVGSTLRKAEEQALEGTEAGDLLKEARTSWANMKNTYEKGTVGKVLRKGRDGENLILDENVAKRLWSSPTATRQYIKAAQSNPEALELLKGHAVNELTSKTQGKQWVDWVNSHKTQIKDLFGEDAKAFVAVSKDILSENWVGDAAKAASMRQSTTAQVNAIRESKLWLTKALQSRATSIGATIAGAGTGGMTGGIGTVVGGATGGYLGYQVEKAAGNTQKAVNEILLKASMDKDTLRALMQKPTPQSMKTIFQGIAKTAANSEVAAIATGLAKSVGGDRSPEDIGMRDATGQTYLTPQALKREESMDMNTAPQAQVQLLDAIESVESDGDINALSPKSARGAYQFIDATGKEYHRRLGIKEPYDPSNKAQQRKLAEAYLSDLLTKYEDERIAIAGYNYGEPKLDKVLKGNTSARWEDVVNLLPKETRNYVPRVLNRLKG